MNCEKYLEQILDLAEGELDEKFIKEVNLHIFNCLNCKNLYELYKNEKEIYSKYLFDIEPPAI